MSERTTRLERQAYERAEKANVRRRDRVCRFPLCGCRALKLPVEVAHCLHHKGMGGNPTGTRSTRAGMILLCRHRHRDGAVSWHHGTLRAQPLTDAGTNGPVAWEVEGRAAGLNPYGGWRCIAVERAGGVLASCDADTLARLAQMVL